MEKPGIKRTSSVEESERNVLDIVRAGQEERAIQHKRNVWLSSFRDHALHITVSNFRDWFRRIGINLV